MKKSLLFILILFSIKSFAQIGGNINTPTELLDINGTARLRNVPEIGNNDKKYYTLVADKQGVLKKVTASKDNSYAFTTITFRIENVNKDWISNFDTKIPVDDYVVIITGFNFIISANTALQSHIEGTFQPTNIYLFAQIKNNVNTWRISADYPSAATQDGTNGTWEITTLVISKTLIKDFGNFSVNLKGSSVGSLNSKPQGL